MKEAMLNFVDEVTGKPYNMNFVALVKAKWGKNQEDNVWFTITQYWRALTKALHFICRCHPIFAHNWWQLRIRGWDCFHLRCQQQTTFQATLMAMGSFCHS